MAFTATCQRYGVVRPSAVRLVAIAAAIVCSGVALPAQLPFAATYDNDRQVRFEGAVTRVEWVNPRAYLFLDVRDANGTTVNWAVEIGNALVLERNGWKRSSVRVGDIVTVEGNPAIGLASRAFARSVTLKRTAARLFAAPPPR